MTERPADPGRPDPGRPDPGWPDPDGLGSEPRPEHDTLRLLHFVQARDPEALAQWMTAFGAVNASAANASRAEAPVPEDARPQDAKPEGRLEEAPPVDGFHSQAALGPGAVCGPFRIERKLGRGGMGNVYLATRADDLDLQVALKTLHSWNPKMMSLFRKECKILSGLRHVNIAHLIDAGTLPSGQPWLAMEYVAGQTLDAYLARHDLDLGDRLRLFLKICDALSHAHQQMVIHRDLKPRNIMVGPDGEPKLLDFGIAAVLNPDTGEQRTVTALSTPMMTPEYASPEQVNGQRLSATADVYSLGILFYEMLTGQRPYRLNPRNLARVMRAVNEAPITKPSRMRGADGETTGRFTRQLRGDLDTIALKALERDPKRRYASVEAFAADVRAYLRGLPIEARPATTLYRFRKFVLRNPWPLSLITGVVSFLVLFSAYAAHQQSVISREKRTAEHVTDFLVSMFEQTDPNLSKNREVSAFEVMENGRRQLETGLLDQPEVEVRLKTTMGKVYNALGHHEQAQELFEGAVTKGDPSGKEAFLTELELIRTLQLRGKYDAAQAHLDALAGSTGVTAEEGDQSRLAHAQGRQWFLKGNYVKATAAFEEAEAGLPSRSMEERFVYLQERAELESGLGNYDNAVAELESLLALQQERYGTHHLEIAKTYQNLGLQYIEKGDYENAELNLDLAEANASQLVDKYHPILLKMKMNRAMLLRDKGEFYAAGRLLQEALLIAREENGRKHLLVGECKMLLSGILLHLGSGQTAEELAREALSTFQDIYGDFHPRVSEGLADLARLLRRNGHFYEAKSIIMKAMEIDKVIFERGHPHTTHRLDSLARIHIATRDYEKALPLLKNAIEIQRNAFGKYHPHIIIRFNNLATCYSKIYKFSEAGVAFDEALGVIDELSLENHPHSVVVYNNISHSNFKNGFYKMAEKEFRRTLTLRMGIFHQNHVDIGKSLRNLGRALHAQGKYLEADESLQHALSLFLKTLGENHLLVMSCNKFIGDYYISVGKLEEATQHYRTSMQLATELLPQDHDDRLFIQSALAGSLLKLGQLDEARTLLDQAKNQAQSTQDRLLLPEIGHQRARLLRLEGLPQHAETLLREVLAKRREVLRPKHPLIADALIDLADVLADLGCDEEALPLIEETAAIYADCLPPEHEFHRVADSIKGQILRDLGDSQKARALLGDAYRAIADRLGEDHYLTHEAANRLTQGRKD